MMEDFTKDLSRAVLIAAAFIIPVGLILSGVFGGWHGLAGGAVGFGVAILNCVLALWLLKFALKKPTQAMPGILMASYMGRLIVIAGVLTGLYYVKTLNIVAVVACFGAMYIAQIGLEIFFAWRSFGIITKKDQG